MKKFLLWTLSILLVLVVGFFAVGYWYVKNNPGAAKTIQQAVFVREETPTETLAQQVLYMPDTVLLAKLDYDVLEKLGLVKFDKQQTPDMPTGVISAVSNLALSKAQVVTHVDLALFTVANKPEVAVVVHGKFNSASLEKDLGVTGVVKQRKDRDFTLNEIPVRDIKTCDEKENMAYLVQGDRIIMGNPIRVVKIAQNMLAGPKDVYGLSQWIKFRKNKVFAAWVRAPHDLNVADVVDPFSAAIVSKASKDTPFEGMRAGLVLNQLAQSGDIIVELEANDPAMLKSTYDEWKINLASFSESAKDRVPTLSALVNATRLSYQDKVLSIAASMNKAWFNNAKQLPVELFGYALATASQTMTGQGANPKDFTQQPSLQEQDKLATNLTEYKSITQADLKPYDEKANFAGKANITVGPFGISVESAKYDDLNKQVVLELKAMGTGFPDLPFDKDLGELTISGVQNAAGESLRTSIQCGPNRTRKDSVGDFRSQFGNRLEAKAKIALVKNVRLADVQTVKGNVSVSIPATVSTISIPDINKLPFVRKINDLTVTVDSIQHGDIVYKLAGNINRFVELRALNQAGKPLQHRSSSSTTQEIKGGKMKTVNASYAGAVKGVEVYVVDNELALNYPFSLNQPGIETADAAQLSSNVGDYSRLDKSVFNKRPARFANTGPFAINPEQISYKPQLQARLNVGAPSVDALQYVMQFAKLNMHSYRDKKNKVHSLVDEKSRFGFNRMEYDLDFRPDWQDKTRYAASVYLYSNHSIPENDVSQLLGDLTVNYPSGIKNVVLKSLQLAEQYTDVNMSAFVSEVGRGGYVLSVPQGVDNIIALTGLDEKNRRVETKIKSLRLKTKAFGQLYPEIEFSAPGAVRLEITVAENIEQVKYPVIVSISDLKAK